MTLRDRLLNTIEALQGGREPNGDVFGEIVFDSDLNCNRAALDIAELLALASMLTRQRAKILEYEQKEQYEKGYDPEKVLDGRRSIYDVDTEKGLKNGRKEKPRRF